MDVFIVCVWCIDSSDCSVDWYNVRKNIEIRVYVTNKDKIERKREASSKKIIDKLNNNSIIKFCLLVSLINSWLVNNSLQRGIFL